MGRRCEESRRAQAYLGYVEHRTSEDDDAQSPGIDERPPGEATDVGAVAAPPSRCASAPSRRSTGHARPPGRAVRPFCDRTLVAASRLAAPGPEAPGSFAWTLDLGPSIFVWGRPPSRPREAAHRSRPGHCPPGRTGLCPARSGACRSMASAMREQRDGILPLQRRKSHGTTVPKPHGFRSRGRLWNWSLPNRTTFSRTACVPRPDSSGHVGRHGQRGSARLRGERLSG